MKIVPLKNKTVKCNLEGYDKNVLFEIKIFDVTEYVEFRNLAVRAVKSDGQDLYDIYQQIIDMGIVGVEGVEGDSLKLEIFLYESLCNKITEVNTVTRDNVKK